MGLLGDQQPRIEAAINRTVDRLLEDSVQRIRASLGTQGSYRIHSRPGLPPDKQTGDLQSSIQMQPAQDGEGHVVCEEDYGTYLELGTSRISPRPFMGPEVQRLQQTLLKTAARYLAEELGI